MDDQNSKDKQDQQASAKDDVGGLGIKAWRDFEAGYVDTMADSVFKFVFGKPEASKFTIAFLNAVLAQELGRKIKDVKFLNTEKSPDFVAGKGCRFDICCELDGNERVDVEVQVSNQSNLLKRSLFYWSKLYQEGINRGEDYIKLRPAFVVMILDFDLFNDARPFRSLVVCDKTTGEQASKDLGLYYLEVPKILNFMKNKEKLSELERWLCFFSRNLSIRERKSYCHEDEVIMEAMERVNDFFKDPSATKVYIDQQVLRMVRKEERMEGIEEGKKLQLEATLLSMLQNKYSCAAIAKVLNVSLEDVKDFAIRHGYA